MTVCYEIPTGVGRYTIEYDRDAPWDAQWLVSFVRNGVGPRPMRRYATYTEARWVVGRLKDPRKKGKT